MTRGSWNTTQLWTSLARCTDGGAEAVQNVLRDVMPQIEAVLESGGTAALDFTLHDAHHAYRVATRMIELIPQDTLPSLSSYELGLLLLSAYLHDIGMTPERSRLSDLFRYLLSGTRGALEDRDVNDLQNWLDEHHGGLVPPLDKALSSGDAIDTAEEILTYFARDRHNDWGEEQTRKLLQTKKIGNYIGWLEDLVLLCKSHHYGYEKLAANEFNPRLVGGTNGSVVNLRYLAAVLRIADVLEFDPERTPDVIFRHRDVREDSIIYWHKDHEITLLKDGDRLILSARPTSARLHKAIADTVAQVDAELALVRRLADNHPFDVCPPLANRTAHRWPLPSSCNGNIQPLNGAYEFIDGAFRPDTQRLLGLLSGQALYGTPMAAVRELLQNAMDAVKERIAYLKLRSTHPDSRDLDERLALDHLIELQLETDAAGVWLACHDTGMGMSKNIIKDHLLVSGKSTRRDLLELERRCRNAGFTLGRTGQFGIGVLSYFMIAQRVEFNTLRGPEDNTADRTGWQFTTAGVSSFGELKKVTREATGTTVRLLLRPAALLPSAQDWARKALRYLEEILCRVPCRVHLFTKTSGVEGKTISPGWTSGSDDVEERVRTCLDNALRLLPSQSHFEQFSGKLEASMLSRAEREQRERSSQYWNDVRHELARATRHVAEEGLLPGGLGRYRIRIISFELVRGSSLAFLRGTPKHDSIQLNSIGHGLSVPIPGRTVTSWKGIIIRSDESTGTNVLSQSATWMPMEIREGVNNVLLDVDFESVAPESLSVDRGTISLSSELSKALQHARHKALDALRTFARSNSGSPYRLLNWLVSQDEHRPTPSDNWLNIERNGRATWKALTFPLVDLYIHEDISECLAWKGHPVKTVPLLPDLTGNSISRGLAWHSAQLAPSRILRGLSYATYLIPLWQSPLKPTVDGPLRSKFPPNWHNLAGARFRNYAGTDKATTVWNDRHPLPRWLSMEARQWCDSTLGALNDPLPHREALLQDRARAATWLERCLVNKDWQLLWNGLPERDPGFLPQIFRLLTLRQSGRKPPRILFWRAESLHLDVLTPSTWSILTTPADINAHLPDPGPEWKLIEAREPTSTTPRKKSTPSRRPRQRPQPPRAPRKRT